MLMRHPQNPIITRNDIPNREPHLVDVSSVFNPGAVRFGDQYVLLLRVQNRGRETFFLTAWSDDGLRFHISPEPVLLCGIEKINEKIYHCYDARITAIHDAYYIMFAMDMDAGCRLGLAQTRDFCRFEFMGIVSEDDNRNGVLFPDRIGGRFLRLDRPNRVQLPDGPRTGDAIWLSESDDLLRWRPLQPVISGRFHYWDESVGAGPPPIKTEKGWLQIYHGVAGHFGSVGIYQAGVMLLDLQDPARVIGRSRYNILEPRELYELTGQVPNVVFPSGAIVLTADEQGFAAFDSEVFVYYGAADTCVGLAIGRVEDLIDASEGDPDGHRI